MAGVEAWLADGSVAEATEPKVVLLMGVCGSGKTTLGGALAEALAGTFLEGDDFHSAENKAKMGRGEPLTDDDRWPWLDALAAEVARVQPAGRVAVVGCSALKLAYRARLQARCSPLITVHLHGSEDVLAARMEAREGHYMAAGMLESQVAILEPPAPAEFAVAVDVSALTPAEVLTQTLSKLVPHGVGKAVAAE